MPKRKRDESKEERWERKRKKYEARILERRAKYSNRIIYSDEEDVLLQDHPMDAVDEFDRDRIASESGNIIVTPPVSPVPASGGSGAPDAAAAAPPLDSAELESELDPDIDTEVLKALGDFEDDPLEWGGDIQDAVAKRFERVLLQGLKKEEKAELNKKYLFPKNAPSTKPPSLNPELSTGMLQDNAKTRDKRLFDKQSQLGRALAALGSAMTSLLKKNVDKTDVVQKLHDVGKLLADSHFAETETRRALIIPLIDKPLVDSFKDRRRDNFLFGDKLCELVKNSRGIIKTGHIIRGPSTSTSGNNLNWRGPPSRYRQSYRAQAGPSQSIRAGGQRIQYTQRRRAPPAPSAPPRRPAPPPPQPAAPRRPPPAHRQANYPPLINRPT